MILVVENLLFKNEVNFVYDSRCRTNKQKRNVEQLNAKQKKVKEREKYYEIIFKQRGIKDKNGPAAGPGRFRRVVSFRTKVLL